MASEEMNMAMSKLGPYELRGELGRGAMARVWRAWDPNLEREVAIKEPLFDSGLSGTIRDEMGRRFVAEGRAAAKLNHPNIVTIYAADVWDGRPAIVMELIDGTTLADLLRAGPLAPAEALSVLDQLLDAVGYAHKMGVVHRDIKPDNVFVDKSGRVKLADFGIARVDGGANARATMAGSVLGTPGYMSPEQARGAAVDGRSDLFSVGVVGYELLSGKNPFGLGDGSDATTVLYRIVHEPVPELPAQASAGLPADIRPAIMAALAKEPGARPQTAEAFRQSLRTGVASTSATAPVTPLTPEGDLAKKAAKSSKGSSRWFPYAVAAAIALGLLAGLFFSANAGRGGGGAIAPESTAQEADAPAQADMAAQEAQAPEKESGYYLDVDGDTVALFDNITGERYKAVDLSAADLTDEVRAQLGTSTVYASETLADAAVDTFRQMIEKVKGAYPPRFTTASASNTRSPEDYRGQYLTYYPEYVLDGDITTGWNDGDLRGSGQWIQITATEPQRVSSIDIYAGYHKTEEIYYNNYRPSRVRLTFEDGSSVEHDIPDNLFGRPYTINLDKPVATSLILVSILDAYPGNKYNDCAISEISVR